MSEKIIEAFGSFIVDLGGEQPSIFSSEQEASTALAAYENGAEHRSLALSYCQYNGLVGKNAVGKVNVITSFLAWVDAGTPSASASVVENVDVEILPPIDLQGNIVEIGEEKEEVFF
jgi:hypothetical protein